MIRCDISVELITGILNAFGDKIKTKLEVLKQYLEKYDYFHEESLNEICDYIFNDALYFHYFLYAY